MRKIIALLIGLVGLTGPALAEELLPAPVPHTSFSTMTTGAHALDAFNQAVTLHGIYLAAETAYAEAAQALQAGVIDHADNLAELAMATADAEDDLTLKRQAYEGVAATYEAALANYASTLEEPTVETEVFDPQPLIERLDALEAENEALTNALAAAEQRRAALEQAVCAGHDYDHAHADAYALLCHPEQGVAEGESIMDLFDFPSD